MVSATDDTEVVTVLVLETVMGVLVYHLQIPTAFIYSPYLGVFIYGTSI